MKRGKKAKVLENLYGKDEVPETTTNADENPLVDHAAVTPGEKILPLDVATRLFTVAPPPVGYESSEPQQVGFALPDSSPDSESSSDENQLDSSRSNKRRRKRKRKTQIITNKEDNDPKLLDEVKRTKPSHIENQESLTKNQKRKLKKKRHKEKLKQASSQPEEFTYEVK